MSVAVATRAPPRRRHYDSDSGEIFLRQSLEFSFAIYGSLYGMDATEIPTPTEFIQYMDAIGNVIRKIRRGGVKSISVEFNPRVRLCDFLTKIIKNTNTGLFYNLYACLTFSIISIGLYSIYTKDELTAPNLEMLSYYISNHLLPGTSETHVPQLKKTLLSYIDFAGCNVAEISVSDAVRVAKISPDFFNDINIF